LGGFAAGHAGWAADTNGTEAAAPIQTKTQAAQMPDFADLVAKVSPAVVSVTTHLRPRTAAMEGPEGQMPFPFNQMPGMQMPGMQGPGGHPRAIEARGSGFIINANGTIVTNNHVVADARSVSVTLADGTELPAHVVGRDPRTDIAVLKVDAGHPLPFIELGESNNVRPGQWVVAMGNPFGLGGTVTSGIVSARGRDIGEGPYDNFIQVDAPINQGNSGGPLFTQDGRVIGINTAILSPSGGSVGIGFAIPSDTVRTVVAQLETSGHVTRGYLGVEAQKLAPGMSQALHLPNGANQGALIATVQPDSPAAKAGLQPGDVIEQVDGKAVANPRDLAVDIAAVKPGEQVPLSIVRNGETQTVTVSVATMPNQTTASNDNGGDPSAPATPRVGLALAPISPDLRDQLGLPEQARGAVVEQVTPGSPADSAGIRQGDVVVGVGNKSVTSPQAAIEAIRNATKGGHDVALRILRNGHAAFVALDMHHVQQAPQGSDDDSNQG
jgi:serine protease Do